MDSPNAPGRPPVPAEVRALVAIIVAFALTVLALVTIVGFSFGGFERLRANASITKLLSFSIELENPAPTVPAIAAS